MKVRIRKEIRQTEVVVIEAQFCDRCHNPLEHVWTEPELRSAYPNQRKDALIIELIGGTGMLLDSGTQTVTKYTSVFCQSCAKDLLQAYPELAQVEVNTDGELPASPMSGTNTQPVF